MDDTRVRVELRPVEEFLCSSSYYFDYRRPGSLRYLNRRSSMKNLPYSLALALKDAGFPQNLTEEEKAFVDEQNSVDDFKMVVKAYVPTLEELIEELSGNGVLNILGENEAWVAYIGDMKRKSAVAEHGSTPSEALAKLYLALHDKE